MIEQIKRDKPMSATHWQAGHYYKENSYGVWFVWKGDHWSGSFEFPSILSMTRLKD